MNQASRVCLGVIVGVKGLRGEVRVKSFTADPADVDAYGPVETKDGRKLEVTVTERRADVVIVRIKGVADRNAAEAMKGVELYVDRKALPAAEEGSYYHADLIGLGVALVSGESLGTVAAVHNFGGGDMIEVTMAGGRSELVPFTDATIASVDLKGGMITINPLKGLFAEETDEEEKKRESDDT